MSKVLKYREKKLELIYLYSKVYIDSPNKALVLTVPYASLSLVSVACFIKVNRF
jgi:hypothetical protein